MKVLMVSKACYAASYRRKLEELAAMPDVELTLLLPPYWPTSTGKLTFEPGQDSGYKVLIEEPVLNGHFHLHFYRKLPDLIRTIQPDILHIDEEPYDFVTYHGVRAAAGLARRTLFFTWQNIPRAYPLPFGWFERSVLSTVHCAIAGNQDAAHILRDKGYARPLYVIPQFGVDPDLFRPAEDWPQRIESFSQERPFRIGFSGRLVEEKGLLVLLRAVARLEGDWELLFLGNGPLQGRLIEEATAMGIGQRLRFLGSVPSEDVPRYIQEFDVLVNPSLTWRQGQRQWKEQFGRSLVEAMACGVPVIGSNSGEIPNVIADAGLVAPEGDVDALHAHLATLMASTDQRLNLARRGRAHALANYTQQRIAQQTYACYQQLLQEP